MSVPPGSRMTTFSLTRSARTVKYGEATARLAKRMARNIQNLAATRLLVMASMAENFICSKRIDRQLTNLAAEELPASVWPSPSGN